MPEYQKAPEHELEWLSMLPGTDFGKVYFGWLRKELDAERDAYERHPRISDDPLTDDFRYKLGVIAGLKRALAMPDEALKIIQTRRK